MTHEAVKRRSRFKREPLGKRVELTDRDFVVMSWLYRYRYLTSQHLVALIEPRSDKRFIERLGDLYHETDLIDRPMEQWNNKDANHKHITYELSATGIDKLKSHGSLPQRATLLTRRHRRGVSKQFDHALMICNSLVEIELQCLQSEHERFVCVDEILSRASDATRSASNPLVIPVTLMPSPAFPELTNKWDTHVIPDALYGIERIINGERFYKFWALECERTSPKSRKLNLSSQDKKELVYKFLTKSGLHQKHFGIPNLSLRIVR